MSIARSLPTSLRETNVWRRFALPALLATGALAVAFIGAILIGQDSGIDGVNIRTALWLSGKLERARIVARCFDQSSFTEQISRECGFEIVSTAELLLASMRPEAPELFG